MSESAMLPARGESFANKLHSWHSLCSDLTKVRSLGACLKMQTLRKSEMDKINRVVQMNPSLKRTQQQHLKAEFINLRLSAAASEVINSGWEAVEEENT